VRILRPDGDLEGGRKGGDRAHSPIAPAVEDRITKVEVPAELPVSGVAIPVEQMASVTILLGATLIVVGVYVRRRERDRVA